jgi:transcriptional regulator with XRE-family HTH domain
MAREVSEFSGELSRLMDERGVGVRELARQVPCNPGYVSNLRNGRKRPSPSLAERLDDVLDAGGTLVALAAGMFSAQARDGAEALDEATRLRVHALSGVQLDELVSHLSDQWHGLVKTDNLLGPRHALGAVRVHLGVIDALLQAARPAARQRVLRIGARYAESAAWLNEDAGDLRAAQYWTGRAMEWALEAGDRPMVAWTLFRRSQQVMRSRDAAQVAGLAAAARREADAELAPPGMAAILQQEAHAHALDGVEAACHRSLDDACDLAAAPDDPGDASGGHGSFCTHAYLDMQRGACWLTLGHPARAIAPLEAAIGALPPAYRRDRGVAFSHQAAALAAVCEPAEAGAAAFNALAIARESGSGRILHMVVQIANALEPYSHLEQVAGLRESLAETPAL